MYIYYVLLPIALYFYTMLCLSIHLQMGIGLFRVIWILSTAAVITSVQSSASTS